MGNSSKYFRLSRIVAIGLIGVALIFPASWSRPIVRAQPADHAAPAFTWDYQLDLRTVSLASARQVEAGIGSVLPANVSTSLRTLPGNLLRLQMSGNEGIEQVRQVIFSPELADFIGGAAEVDIFIPAGGQADLTVTLESNITTGYGWEMVAAESAGITQSGSPACVARSAGYGVPCVQTLLFHKTRAAEAKIKMLYRRPFDPGEILTRHLRIDLPPATHTLDLSNPHPKTLNTAETYPQSGAITTQSSTPVLTALPAALDWRTAGIVTPIRNQFSCGSCWAFGTVGIMESAIRKGGGTSYNLSEQFLVSCNQSYWSCAGGWEAHAYHYDRLGVNQITIGAVMEADKPYTATNGTCSVAYNHPLQLAGWDYALDHFWITPTIDQLKNTIATYGPVAATVCVGSAFQIYNGGIFTTDQDCGGSPNHMIILVGWNDAGGYWILRNSWGTGWGDDGYMNIAYGVSDVGENVSWVTWAGTGPVPFEKISPSTISIPSNSTTLNWTSSSNATSYEYCVNNSGHATCDGGWTSVGANTSASLSGLPTGIHSWQVRAWKVTESIEANGGAWGVFVSGAIYKNSIPVVIH